VKHRKRTRWEPLAEENKRPEENTEAKAPEERKRKSRWGSRDEQVAIPTELESGAMTTEQRELYVLRVRLQEISHKLVNVMALIPPEEERSPSPEPVYNAQGQRVNTREQRVRDRLLKERAELLERAMKISPAFAGAAGGFMLRAAGLKFEKKLPIPLDQNPEYNFIGLIIGPRGNTQKRMEKETGAKIVIRGKGSMKDGKKKDNTPQPGEDEPLHVFITADTQESLDKAVKMVEALLVPVDESKNEHKARQLRELALMNGTLRNDVICRNCGEYGHRIYQCPQKQGSEWAPANVRCAICGDRSHPTSDCPSGQKRTIEDQMEMKDKYMDFMAELESPASAGAPAAFAQIPPQQMYAQVYSAYPPNMPYGYQYAYPPQQQSNTNAYIPPPPPE
jgi:splicing factor 1